VVGIVILKEQLARVLSDVRQHLAHLVVPALRGLPLSPNAACPATASAAAPASPAPAPSPRSGVPSTPLPQNAASSAFAGGAAAAAVAVAMENPPSAPMATTSSAGTNCMQNYGNRDVVGAGGCSSDGGHGAGQDNEEGGNQDQGRTGGPWDVRVVHRVVRSVHGRPPVRKATPLMDAGADCATAAVNGRAGSGIVAIEATRATRKECQGGPRGRRRRRGGSLLVLSESDSDSEGDWDGSNGESRDRDADRMQLTDDAGGQVAVGLATRVEDVVLDGAAEPCGHADSGQRQKKGGCEKRGRRNVSGELFWKESAREELIGTGLWEPPSEEDLWEAEEGTLEESSSGAESDPAEPEEIVEADGAALTLRAPNSNSFIASDSAPTRPSERRRARVRDGRGRGPCTAAHSLESVGNGGSATPRTAAEGSGAGGELTESDDPDTREEVRWAGAGDKTEDEDQEDGGRTDSDDDLGQSFEWPQVDWDDVIEVECFDNGEMIDLTVDDGLATTESSVETSACQGSDGSQGRPSTSAKANGNAGSMLSSVSKGMLDMDEKNPELLLQRAMQALSPTARIKMPSPLSLSAQAREDQSAVLQCRLQTTTHPPQQQPSTILSPLVLPAPADDNPEYVLQRALLTARGPQSNCAQSPGLSNVIDPEAVLQRTNQAAPPQKEQQQQAVQSAGLPPLHLTDAVNPELVLQRAMQAPPAPQQQAKHHEAAASLPLPDEVNPELVLQRAMQALAASPQRQQHTKQKKEGITSSLTLPDEVNPELVLQRAMQAPPPSPQQQQQHTKQKKQQGIASSTPLPDEVNPELVLQRAMKKSSPPALATESPTSGGVGSTGMMKKEHSGVDVSHGKKKGETEAARQKSNPLHMAAEAAMFEAREEACRRSLMRGGSQSSPVVADKGLEVCDGRMECSTGGASAIGGKGGAVNRAVSGAENDVPLLVAKAGGGVAAVIDWGRVEDDKQAKSAAGGWQNSAWGELARRWPLGYCAVFVDPAAPGAFYVCEVQEDELAPQRGPWRGRKFIVDARLRHRSSSFSRASPDEAWWAVLEWQASKGSIVEKAAAAAAAAAAAPGSPVQSYDSAMGSGGKGSGVNGVSTQNTSHKAETSSSLEARFGPADPAIRHRFADLLAQITKPARLATGTRSSPGPLTAQQGQSQQATQRPSGLRQTEKSKVRMESEAAPPPLCQVDEKRSGAKGLEIREANFSSGSARAVRRRTEQGLKVKPIESVVPIVIEDDGEEADMGGGVEQAVAKALLGAGFSYGMRAAAGVREEEKALEEERERAERERAVQLTESLQTLEGQNDNVARERRQTSQQQSQIAAPDGTTGENAHTVHQSRTGASVKTAVVGVGSKRQLESSLPVSNPIPRPFADGDPKKARVSTSNIDNAPKLMTRGVAVKKSPENLRPLPRAPSAHDTISHNDAQQSQTLPKQNSQPSNPRPRDPGPLAQLSGGKSPAARPVCRPEGVDRAGAFDKSIDIQDDGSGSDQVPSSHSQRSRIANRGQRRKFGKLLSQALKTHNAESLTPEEFHALRDRLKKDIKLQMIAGSERGENRNQTVDAGRSIEVETDGPPTPAELATPPAAGVSKQLADCQFEVSAIDVATMIPCNPTAFAPAGCPAAASVGSGGWHQYPPAHWSSEPGGHQPAPTFRSAGHGSPQAHENGDCLVHSQDSPPWIHATQPPIPDCGPRRWPDSDDGILPWPEPVHHGHHRHDRFHHGWAGAPGPRHDPPANHWDRPHDRFPRYHSRGGGPHQFAQRHMDGRSRAGADRPEHGQEPVRGWRRGRGGFDETPTRPWSPPPPS